MKEKNEMKAPIVEVFYSIQGEGKSAGIPVVFVRFFGCTLHCRFNGRSCDTPYAVFEDGNKIKKMTVDEVVEAIRKLPSKHIVFTGGEPTVQQKFMVELMDKLDEKSIEGNEEKYFFEVETNGTIKLSPDFREFVDWFNISLKLKSSNQRTLKMDKLRINDKAIKSFPPAKSCFKFVVAFDSDMKEIEELTEKYKHFPVYLMPRGETRKEQLENMKDVGDWCLIHGWKFSPRLHILIWDKRRGI